MLSEQNEVKAHPVIVRLWNKTNSDVSLNMLISHTSTHIHIYVDQVSPSFFDVTAKRLLHINKDLFAGCMVHQFQYETLQGEKLDAFLLSDGYAIHDDVFHVGNQLVTKVAWQILEHCGIGQLVTASSLTLFHTPGKALGDMRAMINLLNQTVQVDSKRAESPRRGGCLIL